MDKNTPSSKTTRNSDYFVWRVRHAKEAAHDSRVRHVYSLHIAEHRQGRR